MLDRLGAPPADAAGLDLWVRRVLAELLMLQMRGEVGTELAASVRATCGEIRRNIPEPSSRGEHGDDDEDDDDGPKLTETTGDGSLRVER